MVTRIPIKNLFDYLKGGKPVSEFLEDFPSLNVAHFEQVIKMAQQSLMSVTKVANENFVG